MTYAYHGSEALRQAIDKALRRVVDADLALNIVDLGLVYGVNAGDDEVEVRLTMTSEACPVTDLILRDLDLELAGVIAPDARILVELVWSPPWQPELMTERAKAFMGW